MWAELSTTCTASEVSANVVDGAGRRQPSWIMTTIHHAKYDAGQRVASRTGASEFAVMRAPHAARRYAVDVEVVGDHRCRGTQARRRNRPAHASPMLTRLDLASDRCGVGVSGLWWVSDILRGMSLEGLVAQVGQVLGDARSLYGTAPQGGGWSSTQALSAGRDGIATAGVWLRAGDGRRLRC